MADYSKFSIKDLAPSNPFQGKKSGFVGTPVSAPGGEAVGAGIGTPMTSQEAYQRGINNDEEEAERKRQIDEENKARAAANDPAKFLAQYGGQPVVDRTGFETFNPNTKLAAVGNYGYRGEALDAGANTARGSQSRLLALLEQASAGKGPSAAQSQLQAGTEANIRSSLAQAASARGGSKAAATRAAITGAAQAGQTMANQAATLRNQEMLQAYELQSKVADTLRSGDTQIGLANLQKDLSLSVKQGEISSAEAQQIYRTNADALIREAELRAAQDLARGNAAVAMRGQDLNAAEALRQEAEARGVQRDARTDSQIKTLASVANAGSQGVATYAGMGGFKAAPAAATAPISIYDTASGPNTSSMALTNPNLARDEEILRRMRAMNA